MRVSSWNKHLKKRELRNFGNYYQITRPFVPLRVLEFHILIILNMYTHYVYCLIDYIMNQSKGICYPKKSTLYQTIHRLKDKGLIELDLTKPQFHPILKRTYYKITPLVKRVLARQYKWLEDTQSLMYMLDMIPKKPKESLPKE